MAVELLDLVPLVSDRGAPVVATWRRTGGTTAVVLVHGILGWRRLAEIEDLADHLASGGRDVLSIDVQGHGDDPGRFSWGREEWRQVMSAVHGVRAAGARAVDVVGFSFGGYHAALAAARGALVDRLVLVGAPVDLGVHRPFPLGPDFWRSLPWMVRRRRRSVRLEAPRRLGERAMAEAEARSIAQPTLVVHGAADWLVQRRHALQWMAWLPAARLVEIPGGMHAEYLMRSRRTELLAAIDGFLSAALGP